MTMLVYGSSQFGSVHAETTIIPGATLSGRYDSNIFNRPAQLLPPGTQRSDFASIVGGGVLLLHETRDISATLKAGGTFNIYAENSNRNFAAVLLDGSANLDRWVEQYVRGARLQVIEHFRYTPEPPGFLTGVRDQITDIGNGYGIQGFRANSFINTTTFTGDYQVSRDLSVEGGYTFRLRRIGRIQGGDTVGGKQFTYFNTITHTWFGGPRYKLTRNDSIAVLYRQSYQLQELANGGRTFGTNVVTLEGDYSRTFQDWRFSVAGGITFVEPTSRSFPSGSLNITTAPERDTVIHLTLAREARPSFFLAGGVAISNVGRVGISHRIYERLTIDGTVAYAYNELLPSTSGAFKNFTASPKLSYKLTRNITGDLLYQYTNINNDSSATAVEYQVSRHQVGFVLTMEWK